MYFLDYGTYEEEYKHINQNILDGNRPLSMKYIVVESFPNSIDPGSK